MVNFSQKSRKNINTVSRWDFSFLFSLPGTTNACGRPSHGRAAHTKSRIFAVLQESKGLFFIRKRCSVLTEGGELNEGLWNTRDTDKRTDHFFRTPPVTHRHTKHTPLSYPENLVARGTEAVELQNYSAHVSCTFPICSKYLCVPHSQEQDAPRHFPSPGLRNLPYARSRQPDGGRCFTCRRRADSSS